MCVQDECPKVMVNCKYCELDFLRCDLPSHVDACGSRTETCPFCSIRVILRDMEVSKHFNCAY